MKSIGWLQNSPQIQSLSSPLHCSKSSLSLTWVIRVTSHPIPSLAPLQFTFSTVVTVILSKDQISHSWKHINDLSSYWRLKAKILTVAYNVSSVVQLLSLSLCDPTAAAKSLQSCPTLCDPTDGLPPGFPVPGILQARTLWPHRLQQTRLPCPGTCSNSCPLSQWCHPTISSSVVPFSSCLQSFPTSGSFPMSQFFVSGGQRIGASGSVLPMNIQDWFPLGLTGWISLQFKGLSKSLLQHHSSKASILQCLVFIIL